MSACPVFGFTMQMELAPGADADALWASFAALLESRGLRTDEDGGAQCIECVISSEAGQATDLDREAIVAWLHARGEVADFGVGPLVDLEGTGHGR
jgi:uncharacterized protein YggL (DUF469 family)